MANAFIDFSTTAASNTTVGSANVAENCAPSGINNAIRQELAYEVQYFLDSNTLASAATTDLGTIKEGYISISGTTGITNFGTPTNKVEYWLKFDGAVLLTHSAKIILPSGANVTTVAGDVCRVKNEGTDVWRVLAAPPSWSNLSSAANTWTGVNTFTKAVIGTVGILTDGATVTPDFATSNNFSLTIGGNRTLANPSNATAGQSGVIVITQDGTGSRTLAYGTNWKFVGGTDPTLSTPAASVDVLSYYCASSSIIVASLAKAFS